MKRIFFGVFKLKNLAVDLCIILLLAVITTVAFVGINESVPTGVTNGAYYSGSTKSKSVSLMVNVYWGSEYIEDMLKVFDDYNVKTTFFVGGLWVLENEDLVKKIVSGGHELANHGYKHLNQKNLSYEQSKKEIETTHDLIYKLANVKMNLFAPPGGEFNERTVEVANELGYKTIIWTRDTIDWRDKKSSIIFERAVKDVKSGDLVLMHPTEATLAALPKIIENIQGQGLNVATVSQTLGI